MRKKLLALLMALVMVFSLNTTFLAVPGDSATVDNTQKVAAVEWGTDADGVVNWNVKVDTSIVTNSMDCSVYVYNEAGKQIASGWDYVNNTGDEKTVELVFNFNKEIEEAGAGKYYATVELYGYNPEIGGAERIKGTSATAEYKVAEKQLADPTATLKDGVLTIDMVEGVSEYNVVITNEWYSVTMGAYAEAVYYDLSFMVDGTDVIVSPDWYNIPMDTETEVSKDGKTLTFDFAEWFERTEKDYENLYEHWDLGTYERQNYKYTFFVQNISENVSKVQSSKEVEIGEYKIEIELSDEQVEEIIKDVETSIADLDSVKVEDVKNDPSIVTGIVSKITQIPKEELVEKMKDADFAKQIAKLDELYKALVDYKDPVSDTKLVDASKITVVGAALNAAMGEEVQLTVAEPKTKVTVPEKYKAGVQLDINLLVAGKSLEELTVPVTITMPIPAGVDTKDLVILHYHGDATEPAVITPVVKDGNMTFTVTGFSTFVVTNAVAGSPKTADNSVAVVCSMMLLAAAAVVVFRKKATR